MQINIRIFISNAKLVLKYHLHDMIVHYPFTNFVMGYCDHFCLCVCVCVSVTLSVNTIKGELSIRF